jgi:hypothetical protein
MKFVVCLFLDVMVTFKTEKSARDVYRLKRNKDQSYILDIEPPLLLSECVVEAWYKGHQIWHVLEAGQSEKNDYFWEGRHARRKGQLEGREACVHA